MNPQQIFTTVGLALGTSAVLGLLAGLVAAWLIEWRGED